MNLQHECVPVDPFDRAVVTLLDGGRDRAALARALAGRAEVVLSDGPRALTEPAERERALGPLVDEALARLARAALLVDG